MATFPSEIRATGDAGSVLLFDSRLWHAIFHNARDRLRVRMAVRYAPWCLNLDILMPGSVERTQMVDQTGIMDNVVVPVPRHVYDGLPDNVKPSFAIGLNPYSRRPQTVRRTWTTSIHESDHCVIMETHDVRVPGGDEIRAAKTRMAKQEGGISDA